MSVATTACPAATMVSSPMTISPGSAAVWSRAATLTTCPATSAWLVVFSAGATTSPVLTPMRARSRRPTSASTSSLKPSRAARISSAARTARSASSSCRAGTPNTPTTASPMNFSTTPPWYSTRSRIRSK